VNRSAFPDAEIEVIDPSSLVQEPRLFALLDHREKLSITRLEEHAPLTASPKRAAVRTGMIIDETISPKR